MSDSDETQISGARPPQDPNATVVRPGTSPAADADATAVNPTASAAPATAAGSASEDSGGKLKKLGKYDIESVLGEGAMGIVYKAKDPFIERTVAIKTIRNDMLDPSIRDEMLARFKREAQAAGQLSHPGIVSVYEYGEEGSTAFISMEFIEGEELADIFERGEKPKDEHVIDFMIQLLEALGFAHNKGIVHRDIKPSNIIITADKRVKLADFGIAHVDTSSLTQSGSVLGTPAFMSPEQCVGSSVDSRSDLFSVGAVLYYILTGEKPFPGSNPFTIMQRVINQDPEPPSSINPFISKRMDGVIARAMAKKPEKRYQTAQAFIDDLKAVRSESSNDTAATLVAASGEKTTSSSSTAGRVAIVLVLLAAAVGAGLYFYSDLFTPAPQLAETPSQPAKPATLAGSQDDSPDEAQPESGVAESGQAESDSPVSSIPDLEIIPTPENRPQPPEITLPTPRPMPDIPDTQAGAAQTGSAELPFTIIREDSSGDTQIAQVREEIDTILEATPEPAPVNLSLTTSRGPTPVYTANELLRATLTSDRDAYIYCFHRDYRGVVMRILPNRFTPDNFLRNGETLSIPSRSDEFDIIMETPDSTESLACMASSEKLPDTVPGIAGQDLVPLNMTLAQIRKSLHESAPKHFGSTRLDVSVSP